jgi:hypothetical protein
MQHNEIIQYNHMKSLYSLKSLWSNHKIDKYDLEDLYRKIRLHNLPWILAEPLSWKPVKHYQQERVLIELYATKQWSKILYLPIKTFYPADLPTGKQLWILGALCLNKNAQTSNMINFRRLYLYILTRLPFYTLYSLLKGPASSTDILCCINDVGVRGG